MSTSSVKRHEQEDRRLSHVLCDDLLELRNMIEVAGLIVACAQKRKESRGLHYTTDYPETRESERHDTVLRR